MMTQKVDMQLEGRSLVSRYQLFASSLYIFEKKKSQNQKHSSFPCLYPCVISCIFEQDIQDIKICIILILGLIESSQSSETFLLCAATIANITSMSSSASELHFPILIKFLSHVSVSSSVYIQVKKFSRNLWNEQ